jgi:two-component system response regulator NreC
MSSSANNPERIRVVVADDHAVMRAGLRSLLQAQRDMVVVGDATCAQELLVKVRTLRPDVVVTDLRMPGGGVLDAIRSMRAEPNAPNVVVFSAFDDPAEAVSSLRSGAIGYVLKQASEDQLLTAVRRARIGRRFVDEPLAARILEAPLGDDAPQERAPLLSTREAAVLDLVARGYTGPEIAAELGLRVGTVETYRHRIRKKLGLRSRAEVIEFARSARYRFRERP